MSYWHCIKETLELLYLAIKIRLYRFYDLLRTIILYYRNPKFRRVDRILTMAYLYDNPYTLARRYLQQQGAADIYAYGETPLITLSKIADACHISASDIVYELGAGRGRCCFWLRCFCGCRVVGIESIPQFVWKAQRIMELASLDGVEFRCEDYRTSDMSDATLIYLYASNQDDEVIEQLIARFSQLKKGTRIVTVSFALTDYEKGEDFTIVSEFDADFIWGEARVYVQTLT